MERALGAQMKKSKSKASSTEQAKGNRFYYTTIPRVIKHKGMSGQELTNMNHDKVTPFRVQMFKSLNPVKPNLCHVSFSLYRLNCQKVYCQRSTKIRKTCFLGNYNFHLQHFWYVLPTVIYSYQKLIYTQCIYMYGYKQDSFRFVPYYCADGAVS